MHCARVAADRWKDSGGAGASKKEARQEEATELAKEGGGGVRAGALVRACLCVAEG